MFLGENNDIEAEYEDLEENNNLDEPEDYDNNNQIEKSTKDPNNVGNRGDNQLRYSLNENPVEKSPKNGLEGFEGIVGVGAGGKKAFFNPKSAAPTGGNIVKKGLMKPKKGEKGSEQPTTAGDKKESGPPLSLGVFGSGMQKK